MAKGLTVIGIDPGKDGAMVALEDSGNIVEVVLTKESWIAGGKWMPSQIMHSLALVHADLVVIECQQARPMQGRSSILQIGYGWGLLVGVCAGMGHRCLEVTAGKWQRSMHSGISSNLTPKHRSCIASSRLLPELNLTPGKRRKPHDGLADAGLLALYGLRILRGEG